GPTVLAAAFGAEVAFEPGGRLVTGSPFAPALLRWPVTPAPGTDPAVRLGPPETVPSPEAQLPRGMALSRDGRTLAAGAAAVQLLDWPGGAVRRKLAVAKDYSHLAVSPDGRWVAAGCSGGREVRVWDGRTGEVVHQLLFATPTSCRVEFSPDPAGR